MEINTQDLLKHLESSATQEIVNVSRYFNSNRPYKKP